MGLDQAKQRALDMQARICGMTCPMPDSADALLEQLRTELLSAWREGRLLTPQQKVWQLLRLKRCEPGTTVIVGGETDFKRRSSEGQFKRPDGGLFNFSLTVSSGAKRQPLTLLAYRFEFRFSQAQENPQVPRSPPWFVRFDFNKPDHRNTERGLRCHLHPADDDVLVPSALLAPLDILDLFLYHVQRPDRRRAITSA